MAWSTSQVAELAGTTLKTVRHYHKLGLLEEPERSPNGYKRYGVKHLVRVMGIRRLTDLGVALRDIPSVEAADERSEQILRSLDDELARNIERQQRKRREIAAVLDDGASLALPPEFGAAADLPQAQQSLLVAYASILTPEAMAIVRKEFAAPRDDVAKAFERLSADATEEERDRLAPHMAAEARRQQEAHPVIKDLDAASRRDGTIARSVVAQALAEFYNRAQLDVLRRIHALLEQEESGRTERVGAAVV